jgi:hypothetical protein
MAHDRVYRANPILSGKFKLGIKDGPAGGRYTFEIDPSEARYFRDA